MVDRVLVVATSRKTRGGITAVLKAHEKMAYWRKYHCHWVQTHRDGPAWRKIAYFVVGLADFLIRLPFYDTVHVHTSNYSAQKRKSVFFNIAKFAGKRIITHLHSSDPESSIGGTYRMRYAKVFDVSDRIVLLSLEWKHMAEKAFPSNKDKMIVIYNPCPTVSAPMVMARGYKYFLFAGTLNRRKGYTDLIRAFARVSSDIKGWRLVLAGNGDIENGRLLAKELGVADAVDFIGWVEGQKKHNVFSEASVYCLPSYGEGFPMGVLDAWSYGLPVITTPVGGVTDVAVDGENVLLFDPGDIDALARKLKEIATNDQLYQKLHKASLDLAINCFNADTISQEIEKLYESL